MFAIETDHLSKRLGARNVVENLALRVPEGCVYGFLGPNGAGKTTTMRLLLGLLRPDRGTIRILRHDLASARRAALAGVGAFIEGASLYDHLTGHANLDLTCRLLRLPAAEIDRVLEIVDMRHAGSMRVRSYSMGMKQRLALARALLGEPRLLLLDEPTNGLDPDGIVAMRALIRELPGRIGGTVFVSSHLLSEMQRTADEVCILRAGSIVMQGPVEAILGKADMVAFALDRAKAGAAMLASAGMDAGMSDAGTILLRGRDGVPPDVAEANRLLVGNGFAVTAIVPHAPNLEDVYRLALAAAPERKAA